MENCRARYLVCLTARIQWSHLCVSPAGDTRSRDTARC